MVSSRNKLYWVIQTPGVVHKQAKLNGLNRLLMHVQVCRHEYIFTYIHMCTHVSTIKRIICDLEGIGSRFGGMYILSSYKVPKYKINNRSTQKHRAAEVSMFACLFSPGCLLAVSLQTAVRRSPLSLLAIKI